MNPAELDTRSSTFVVLALCACACLSRPEIEPVGYSSHVLGANAEVRPLERNLDAKMKLDLNDGLTGPTVPLRTGYNAAKEVQYWDLGQSPTSAEPMWVFGRQEGDVFTELDEEHPPLIDSIPGDTAYSPIRLLFKVVLTDKYRGERIPSLRALEDAAELGLVKEPAPLEAFTNCPVTLKDVSFESGDERPPLVTTPAYYRDREVWQFCVQDSAGMRSNFPSKMGAITFGNAYTLRRENQTTLLDEISVKMDLNADGDMLDVNVVFDSNVGDMGYTSLWKSFEVVVQPTYMFGQAQAFEQLFDKKPGGLTAKAEVVEYKDTALVVNRPLRPVTP